MSSNERRHRRHSSRERSPVKEKRHRSEDRSKKREIHVKEEPRDDYDQDRRNRPSRDDRRDRGDDHRSKRSPFEDNRKKRKWRETGDREDSGKTYEWGKREIKTESGADEEQKPKEKPNFGLSGNLAKDTNVFNGVVIKYNEPPEARKPKLRWRLYPFKGEEALEFIPIHRQSAYLMGRDRRIADVPIDHPSCSKQHAVIQYRLVKRTLDDGRVSRRVRPYVIDLGSANGTFVNNQQIEAERYYELFEKDVVKFGFSSREYVLLHENSQSEADVEDETEDKEGDAQELAGVPE